MQTTTKIEQQAKEYYIIEVQSLMSWAHIDHCSCEIL